MNAVGAFSVQAFCRIFQRRVIKKAAKQSAWKVEGLSEDDSKMNFLSNFGDSRHMKFVGCLSAYFSFCSDFSQQLLSTVGCGFSLYFVVATGWFLCSHCLSVVNFYSDRF